MSGAAREAGGMSPRPELLAAVRDLLDQLEGVGIYIPGEDEGQWATAEGLSFARVEAAIAQAEAAEAPEPPEASSVRNAEDASKLATQVADYLWRLAHGAGRE